MITVSVIIPVYQGKNYLRRCMESVLAQSYTEYEIILVDDGSTDGSAEICDEYAEKQQKITVIHKENGGLSSARNAGLEIASGEYVMFIDADDVIHHKMLETELKVLKEKNADIFICGLKRFTAMEEIDTYTELYVENCVKVQTGLEIEKGFFYDKNVEKYVSCCGKLFKRTIFSGIRFPQGRLFEDEYITYKLYYECERIVITDIVLYFYFTNPDGITKNLNLNKRFDEYDAQKERIEFFKEKKCKELYHLALLRMLNSAQWDLIRCQKHKEDFDNKRGEKFQQQYKETLKMAEKEEIVSFGKNYDFYVLAYPEKVYFFRVRRQWQKLRKLAGIIIAVFLCVIGLSVIKSKYELKSVKNTLQAEKISKEIRLIQITDLHNSIFGSNNKRLVSKVVDKSPDMILITGDLLNANESDNNIATTLLKELSAIAPTYVSLGNHELEYEQNYGVNISSLYESAGATVLNRQYEDITINNQPLRIGGIYGYCLPDKYLETGEADLGECMFLWDFENTDRYKILLSHIPIAWLKNDGLEEWDIDCVFSGHLHGGQVILSGIGGAYAPDMGWFPGRLRGVFDSEDGKRHLVLSAGLGNTEIIPRFNNIPEIVCVDLVPEMKDDTK